MKIVPEEKCVRVRRKDSLGWRGSVDQRESTGRGDDLIEQSEGIEFEDRHVPVRVEIAEGRNSSCQPTVEQSTRLSRRDRCRRRAIEPRGQLKEYICVNL